MNRLIGIPLTTTIIICTFSYIYSNEKYEKKSGGSRDIFKETLLLFSSSQSFFHFEVFIRTTEITIFQKKPQQYFSALEVVRV